MFRCRFEILGGHIHCRIFAGNEGALAFSKCGDLVFRKGPEFFGFVKACPGMDFIGERETDGLEEATRP
jgi:hypothetical protein